jgi:transposase-like protein
MEETDIKVAGQWKYLCRAVDKSGDSVDFLLTAKRDLAAARRYLERAINLHGLPEKITMHRVKKGQLNCPNGQAISAAEQFYSLAF